MTAILMTGCSRGESSQKESTVNVETKQEKENDSENSNLYESKGSLQKRTIHYMSA